MCGIAGIINHSGRKIGKQALLRMGSALRHRGPDDEGTYIEKDGGFLLFHNRLSIVDLSQRAHQPMKRGRYVAALNGEIYNFREIRQELEEKGRRFSSDSDAEVACMAYDEWGDRCLDKFRGMFSLAVWDSEKKSIFLARDRFGIKPLYYYNRGGILIFSSEIGAILAAGLIETDLDYDSIGYFLSRGYIAPPKTIYRGVFALEPGHYLSTKQMRVHKTRYYSLKDVFTSAPLDLTRKQVIAEIRNELIKSVRYHLVSDVEVGAFLSGGTDSSSVVSLMRRCAAKRIRTITFAFPGSALDESRYARLVANKFDTDHTRIDIKEKELPGLLEAFFDCMGQPTIDGFNTYCVSLAAKKAGLKVALSGLGGDEIFCGYQSFRAVTRLYNASRMLRSFPVDLLRRTGGLSENLRISLAKNRPSLSDVYFTYKSIFTKDRIGNLLHPDLTRPVMSGFDAAAPDRIGLDGFQDNFSRIMFLEMNNHLPGQLLRDTDAFSMAHSVEVRVPMLDHNLVELVARVPPQVRAERIDKNLLIEAVGDLPSGIYKRKKMGFILPFDSWLRGGLRPVVLKTIRDSRLFNRPYVDTLLDEFDARRLHWSRIWALFVLARFFQDRRAG